MWVYDQINGLKVASLPDSLRTQIAGGCFHAVIEHHQAIRNLIHDGLNGSALALIRPTFEAFIRGAWVAAVASDDEVEKLRREDDFPSLGQMLSLLETVGNVGKGRLMKLKDDHWKRLCSLTHTGSSQILGRLTPTGLGGDGFHDAEILDALTWADWLVIQAVRTIGALADNPNTVRAADERVVAHFAKLVAPRDA
jgi:hypothetical protein